MRYKQGNLERVRAEVNFNRVMLKVSPKGSQVATVGLGGDPAGGLV